SRPSLIPVRGALWHRQPPFETAAFLASSSVLLRGGWATRGPVDLAAQRGHCSLDGVRGSIDPLLHDVHHVVGGALGLVGGPLDSFASGHFGAFHLVSDEQWAGVLC